MRPAPPAIAGGAAPAMPQSRLHIATTGPQDWQARLADPVKQWKRGYSARTAAHAWEAASPGFPPEVAALLGPDAELQLAIVEHKVALPGGTRESQQDLFCLARAGGEDMAVTIEAKVNESFDKTVAEWFAKPSPGKRTRLAALCADLGIADPPPGGLRYQLLHRTAAAVIEARRFHRPVAAMIVHSFSPDARWLDDFAAFAAHLGLDAGPGRAARKTLPCGTALILGWAPGDPAFLAA